MLLCPCFPAPLPYCLAAARVRLERGPSAIRFHLSKCAPEQCGRWHEAPSPTTLNTYATRRIQKEVLVTRNVAAWPSGRRKKWVVLVLWVLFTMAVAGPLAGKLTGVQKNDT